MLLIIHININNLSSKLLEMGLKC